MKYIKLVLFAAELVVLGFYLMFIILLVASFFQPNTLPLSIQHVQYCDHYQEHIGSDFCKEYCQQGKKPMWGLDKHENGYCEGYCDESMCPYFIGYENNQNP